ncbi:hypothetical protein UlMin_010125 [Ulmus minor]
MDLVLSYSPPLNKKCSPLVLKDEEDVAALLASRSDSTCKIPLGVIVEPTEVCAYEKSSQESSDDTDGSHDGFRDNYFDVDYCDSEPTDVGSSRQKLPVFQNVERTENDNGASVTQPTEGNPYVGVHCCSLLNRNANHCQATYVVIGEQVAPQYVGVEKGPGPKGVQTFARTKLGAQISYYKAWRGRKHAHTLIRGSPKQSFHILPSYFHMLEKLNPGTVTRIEVDGESRFKYLFLAFGVAIRGFRYMRKVVGIDGTFLKGQYWGVLLVATAQDGNGQCYPLAWGIVDSENKDAWTWFLTKLKEVIGDTDELALISDRAPSIKKSISTVFEKAHHGACAWHVAQNIKNKFKCADIMGSYWSAVNGYRCEDFAGYMTEISHRYPRVAAYLENEVGFEKWSRCHYLGLRYNITTTNMVESLNSIRIVAMAITAPLTPSRESEFRPRFAQSNGRHTLQLNPVTYHVKGGELEGVVDIFNKTCTCKEFYIDKLPCVHAIAAAHHAQVSFYSLVSPYYTK